VSTNLQKYIYNLEDMSAQYPFGSAQVLVQDYPAATTSVIFGVNDTTTPQLGTLITSPDGTFWFYGTVGASYQFYVTPAFGPTYTTRPGGPGGGGSSANFVTNEVPSGTVDGFNTTFTLAHTPIAGTLMLFQGVILMPATDYTLSTATITFVTAPPIGAVINANYQY